MTEERLREIEKYAEEMIQIYKELCYEDRAVIDLLEALRASQERVGELEEYIARVFKRGAMANPNTFLELLREGKDLLSREASDG